MNRKRIVDLFAAISQPLLLIGVSLYLVIYLVIALTRISYPFELEWMEGGAVVHVQRLLNGEPLYVTPSLDFIPFIYSPFYFYVSALVAYVTGNGFFPLRLVSFVSSLGCFTLIFLIVYKRTSSRWASLMASCLFAATFRLSGAWFDIARVDSLFLFLLLAGIYTFESERFFTRSFASPALLFLSFFTKQTALIIAVALSVAALFTRKGAERLWLPLNFGLLLTASSLLMNALTDGWYSYYVFDLPAQHAILSSMFSGFWTDDIVRHLPIALTACIIPFLGIGNTSNQKVDRLFQDFLILGSLFLASYLSRLHTGGYDNVLMPVYAAIAIYFGIGLAFSWKAVAGAATVQAVLILAVALQFVALTYSPQQQIPSLLDRQQGERLQQLIASFPGEVYLSDHPWYAGDMDKPTQAQDMAVRDILRASDSEEWKRLLEEAMAAAIVEQKYAALIVDFEDFPLRVPDFEVYYELVDSGLSGDAFLPVTGWDRKPAYLYVRRTLQ